MADGNAPTQAELDQLLHSKSAFDIPDLDGDRTKLLHTQLFLADTAACCLSSLHRRLATTAAAQP